MAVPHCALIQLWRRLPEETLPPDGGSWLSSAVACIPFVLRLDLGVDSQQQLDRFYMAPRSSGTQGVTVGSTFGVNIIVVYKFIRGIDESYQSPIV